VKFIEWTDTLGNHYVAGSTTGVTETRSQTFADGERLVSAAYSPPLSGAGICGLKLESRAPGVTEPHVFEIGSADQCGTPVAMDPGDVRQGVLAGFYGRTSGDTVVQLKLTVARPIDGAVMRDLVLDLARAEPVDEPRSGRVTRGTIVNNSSKPITGTTGLDYTATSGTEWEANVGVKLGLEVSVEAEMDVGVKVTTGNKFTAEATAGYTWGANQTVSTNESTEYETTVPPGRVMKFDYSVVKRTEKIPYHSSLYVTYGDGKTVAYSGYEGVLDNVETTITSATFTEYPYCDAGKACATGACVENACVAMPGPKTKVSPKKAASASAR
jgi:hypothetical protein